MKNTIPDIGPHAELLRLIGVDSRPNGFPVMQDVLPEGERGRVRIEHFEVTPEIALTQYMHAQFTGDARPVIPPGRYVRMLVGLDSTDPDYDFDAHDDDFLHWVCMMSDTPAERAEAKRALDGLYGHAFIAGLGLGMLPQALAASDRIKTITIVEKSRDVIDLVGPTLPRNVHVIEGDARTFDPREHGIGLFDSVFLDIWPKIGERMLTEIDEMTAHYEPYLMPGGWMEGWLEEELRTHEAIWGLLKGAMTRGVDVVKSLGWVNSQLHSALQQAAAKRIRS